VNPKPETRNQKPNLIPKPETRAPRLKIETRNLNELKPDPRNARAHSERNLEAIRESLNRFGQCLPIVVDENGIVIGGNGTLEAAKRLNWKQIETVLYSGNESEARALALALNRSAELAEWNLPQLEETIVDLAEVGFDIPALGFTDIDLDVLFPPPPDAKAEPFRTAAPDIEKISQTEEPEKPPPQYALLFDDEKQEKRFHAGLRKLKKQYPEKSVAARIVAFLEEGTG